MSFGRLATVELQLVMHYCDRQSLLTLARCSRFTLQAALDPFAWRELSPLSFYSTRPGLADDLRTPLLRHCGVRLLWQAGGDPNEPGEEELASLLSVPRVSALDALRRSCTSLAVWRRLLGHHAMASLTELTVQCNSARGWPDREWLLLVAELVPRLRTLHLHGHMAGDRQAWAALPQFLHLTDLRAEDLLSNETSGAVHVGQCGALRRLHLSGIYGSLNAPILTAPGLQGLQHLTLDVLFARHAAGVHEEAAPIGWVRCFANLRDLRSLRLINCFGVDAVLEALAQSDVVVTPWLSVLRIHPRQLDDVANSTPDSNLRRWGPRLPSLDALRQLLAARTQLFIELHLPTLMAHRQKNGHTVAEQTRWKSIRDSFAPLLQAHPQHMAVLTNGIID